MNHPSDKKISVVLLDDHEVIRDGLASRLGLEGDINVLASVGTVAELRAVLSRTACDVLLLDFSLGRDSIDGLNLLKHLQTRYPAVRILVVSAHTDIPTIALARKAGAIGFFGKDQPMAALAGAVRNVATGNAYLPPAFLDYISQPSAKDENPLAEPPPLDTILAAARLTLRESEVIRCCLAGLSMTEIAAKFRRSIKTISNQKTSAFNKVGIRTTAELFRIQRKLDGP